MLKTSVLAVAAIFLVATAGAVHAQGGGYHWHPPRQTNPDTVASNPDSREIFAAHPNSLAETVGATSPSAMVRNRAGRIFAGHPNTYYLEKYGGFVKDVSMADK